MQILKITVMTELVYIHHNTPAYEHRHQHHTELTFNMDHLSRGQTLLVHLEPESLGGSRGTPSLSLLVTQETLEKCIDIIYGIHLPTAKQTQMR